MIGRPPWNWGFKDGERKLFDRDGRVILAANYRHGIVINGQLNAKLICKAPLLKEFVKQWMELHGSDSSALSVDTKKLLESLEEEENESD